MSGVIALELDASQLARSRFARSPLAETTNAVEVLAHAERATICPAVGGRGRAANQMVRLRRAARHRRARDQLRAGLIAPIPTRSDPSIYAELAAVADTPVERVRRELAIAFRLSDLRDVMHFPHRSDRDRPPMLREVGEGLQRPW